MAKKSFDTEVLKKNKFWIGLGAFGLLWLVALVVVFFSGDTKAKAEWEAAEKGVKSAQSSRPKTVAYQKPWNEYGEKYRSHKDTIHKQAWDAQAPMYTWPEMKRTPQYPEDLWGEDMNEDTNNRGRFREQYKTQFTGLAALVAPAELEGGIERIVPMREWNKNRAPSREEIWLAQEDYWVRRELLSVVRDAMNSVAFFQEIPLEDKEKKLPDGIAVRKRFRNANWELDLQFEQPKGGGRLVVSEKSTIKNVNSTGRTQSLANPRTRDGLGFRLWQNTSKFDLLVSGEPLAAEQSAPIKLKNADVTPINPLKPFGMVQLLEWEISPVRRVDNVELAYHSHRTFTAGLKVREDLKKLDPEPEEKEGAGDKGAGDKGATTPGGPPAGMMAPSPGKGGGGMKGVPGPGGMGGEMAGPGGGAGSGDATRTNLIDRSRYMHVKEQARHLPVALKLVVEQSHIHDLLTAVANSRLRIQITQVSMQHVRNVRRVAVTGKDQGGETAGGSDMPNYLGGYRPKGPSSMSGMYAGMMQSMGGKGKGGMGGMMPGMPYAPGVSGGMGGGGIAEGPGDRPPPTQPGEQGVLVQDTARLVELTIYGIATLYERFPARKKPEGEAPAPTTPSPGT